MSKRSPVLGYNHNFKHRGLIFHVQTEDSGVDNPHLFTHLFHGGVIISSRKVDYDAASAEDIVKSLMQSQHRAVLKDLKIGTFDEKIDAYLGDKPDLLPRKAGSASGASADQVAAASDGSAAAEPTTPASADSQSAPSEPSAAPVPSPTPPLPATPDLAHSGAISLDTPAAAIPQIIADAPATAPVESPFTGAAEPEAPQPESAGRRHEREHIPTPISMPAMNVDQLGDPMVTFNQSAAPSEQIPRDSIGERSATYSMKPAQKRKRAITQSRQATPLAAPRTPDAPARGAAARPGGKAANPNPQPGTRRSSVVVSRPSVIIGAPARAVGNESSRRSKRRTPVGRRSRNKDLFGNDTVSEKSLDEVIMAYLSEDGKDD